MKKTIFVFVCILQGFGSVAQNNNLHYSNVFEKVQKYYNEQKGDSLFALFSPQMKEGLPLVKTKEVLAALHAQVGKLKQSSLIKVAEGSAAYKGVFEQSELKIVLSLNERSELSGLTFLPPDATEPKEEEGLSSSKDSSNFNIVTESGSVVYGTLVLPQTRHPNIVLFIAGSGPTDRNCNNPMGGGTNAFRMLADSLANAGIASVRFDKRGVAESAAAIGSEASLRFDDYVGDVIRYVKKIKADGRFNKIFILGHSEGSLIGLVAANKEKIDGLVSLAGAGESADILLSRQLKVSMRTPAAEVDSILHELKMSNKVTVENKFITTLFRPSIQAYMSSWFAYNPQTEIKKLSIPVLIIQGSTDLQVSENDARLLKSAQPKARLVIIPNMNHVLKNAGRDNAENVATYNSPSMPVNAQLSAELIQFSK